MIVDAVVIDATSIVYFDGGILPMGNAPLESADKLLREILRLPETTRMANGVSWNEIPIIVLVDEPYSEVFSSRYPGSASSVTVLKVPLRHGWDAPYALPFGWDLIYDRIVNIVREWTFALVERMQMSGWHLETAKGIGQKYASTKIDYDMSRLAPTSFVLTADTDIGQKRIALLRWHETINNVLDELSGAVKAEAHIREYWFQRLFTENPYLLGAASFELVPHPHLIPRTNDPIFRRRQIPDFLRYSRDRGSLSVVEIKRPDLRSSAVRKAVIQVKHAAAFLSDERYADDNADVLEGVTRLERSIVIAGTSSARGFEAARETESGAQIFGFDEINSQAQRRYTFSPSPNVLIAYSRYPDSYRPD